MTKQEIFNVLDQLPDNKDISLLVSDGCDNWDAVEMFVYNFDGEDTAELVFELHESYRVVLNQEIEEKALSDAIDELVRSQEYTDDISETMSDYIGPDQAADVELFIGACRKANKMFSALHIYSVINGGHFPYVDGVNVVGLSLNVIEMEIRHRYKKWDMKEEKILDCKFYPMTQEEAFIKYFKEYDTRLKFCNDDKHSIVDDDLREQYKAWLTKDNYIRYGGDMN
jgi:hypothetical protein